MSKQQLKFSVTYSATHIHGNILTSRIGMSSTPNLSLRPRLGSIKTRLLKLHYSFHRSLASACIFSPTGRRATQWTELSWIGGNFNRSNIWIARMSEWEQRRAVALHHWLELLTCVRNKKLVVFEISCNLFYQIVLPEISLIFGYFI